VRSLIPCVLTTAAGFGAAYWIFASSNPVETHVPLGTATAASASSTEGQVATHSSFAQEAPAPFAGDLRDAVNSDDPFVAASRVMAWLKSATAEDFARLAQDPKNFPAPDFSGFSGQFSAAYFEAFAARWFEVDPDAITAIRRLHEGLRKGQSQEGGLLMAVARIQPELVLNSETEQEGRRLSAASQVAFRTIAEKDPNKARSFLGRLPENLRKEAEGSIIAGIAVRDPLSAISLARNLDPDQSSHVYATIAQAASRIGPGMVRQVFAASEGRIERSSGIVDLLFEQPELAAELNFAPGKAPASWQFYGDAELLQKADAATPEERDEIKARFDQMPEHIRGPIGAALVAAWARTQPREAIEWAIQHAKPDDPASPVNQAPHHAFLRWIHVDRPGALAWLRSLPPSPLRDTIGTNASSYFAEDGELEVALEICKPTGSVVDRSAVTHLAEIYAKSDLSAAAAWIAKLPEASIDEEAISKVIEPWLQKDPAAVGGWLETLPAGTVRDTALKSFVKKTAYQSASAGVAWTETIEDQKLRTDAAFFVYGAYSLEDPTRAREWIANLAGLDENRKARFLRRLP
jgi:hypothetical protein